MAATLTTMRIGETLTIRATPRNPDGSIGQVVSAFWISSHSAVITVEIDSGDPYLAHITAQATGETSLTFQASDAYGPHTGDVAATVLGATRFDFGIGTLILRPDPIAANIVGTTIAAVPSDARTDPGPPNYSGLITDILWSSANGSILFGGPAGGSPPGTLTLAGTLKADVWPDITSGDDEEVEDVITLSAKYDGAPFSSTLPVSTLRTKTITIAQT